MRFYHISQSFPGITKVRLCPYVWFFGLKCIIYVNPNHNYYSNFEFHCLTKWKKNILIIFRLAAKKKLFLGAIFEL